MVQRCVIPWGDRTTTLKAYLHPRLRTSPHKAPRWWLKSPFIHAPGHSDCTGFTLEKKTWRNVINILGKAYLPLLTLVSMTISESDSSPSQDMGRSRSLFGSSQCVPLADRFFLLRMLTWKPNNCVFSLWYTAICWVRDESAN